MAAILDKIIEHKKHEVALLRERISDFGERRASPKRPFIQSLRQEHGLAIIAEVKKASPSKGVICTDFDPVAIAVKYEQSGAKAVSVLTDEHFFQGSTEYLKAVGKAVNLPVLRKDFVIDEVQVRQTAWIEADAMLLIAAALDDIRLKDLYQMTLALDIDPLIEVHTRGELDRVLILDPPLIGVNNRDLSTFVTDIQTSVELRKSIPGNITMIAESGIENGTQARALCDAGVNALLVGESLMRSSDIAGLIRELSCAGDGDYGSD